MGLGDYVRKYAVRLYAVQAVSALAGVVMVGVNHNHPNVWTTVGLILFTSAAALKIASDVAGRPWKSGSEQADDPESPQA